MAHTDTEIDLSEITCLARNRHGVDLSRYRTSCMKRRVSHRMAMLGCADLEEYLGHLVSDRSEMERLLDTVTIHVTGFFRDREVYETLSEKFLPPLVRSRAEAGDPVIRAWSAGCSTGEEPYSIAMMLERVTRAIAPQTRIEVFGTDISEDACRVGMKGEYPEERMAALPPGLARTCFNKEGGRWVIRKRIRDMVKFMAHDMFEPSPFSMIDLVMCRNVLIHFKHDVRDVVISNFHRSLGNGRFLVLGKSEAVTGSSEELFELEEPRSKIYRRKETVTVSKEEAG